MADRLAIAVMGKRRAGKSTTWDTLFFKKTRTMPTPQKLKLSSTETVSVYLVSGSPQERGIPIEKMLPPLPEDQPTVVLCSIQYRADVTDTIEWFVSNGFDLKVIWLNPGFGENQEYSDDLHLTSYLLECGAILSKRDANASIGIRCQEIRETLYGWCWHRGLVHEAT